MRTRSRVSYDQTIDWIVENVYTPGTEDRLVNNHCVIMAAALFRRTPVEIVHEVYATYAQKKASDRTRRRYHMKLVKEA